MRLATRTPGHWPGVLGPIAVLLAVLLVGFSGLVASPRSLIVDDDRPWIDEGYRPGPRPVGNDLTGLFLPRFLWQSACWKEQGAMPQWDPRGFAGRPNVGNPQAGVWYPPAWLAWSWGAPETLGWMTVAHLFWLGLGVFALGRGSGLGRLAATASGTVAMLNPYVIAQVSEGHVPHVWGVSWYPWALLGGVLVGRGAAGGIPLLGASLALSLMTGHPQEGTYLALAVGVWAAYDVASKMALVLRCENEADRMGFRGVGTALALWGMAFLLAIGLSAIEWWPIVRARPWAAGSIGGAGEGPSRLYSLHPLNLFQLISPRALGGPAEYLGRGNLWETLLSVGWAPLVLVVIGALSYPGRRPARGCLVLIGLGLWFAAGRPLGLASMLGWIPGMGDARVPARSLFLVVIACAILAGMGLDVIRSHVDRKRALRWARRYGLVVAAIAGIIAGGVIGGRWIGRGGQGDDLGTAVFGACARIARDGLTVSVVVLLGAVFLWMRWRPGRGERSARMIAILLMAELSLSTMAALPLGSAGRFLGPDAISEALERSRPPGPVRVRARDAFYTDLDAWRDGVEKTNLQDLFQIRHAEEVYGTLYPVFEEPDRGARRRLDAAAARAALDRLGVALVVTDRPARMSIGPVVATGRRSDSAFEILANESAMPRAWVVPEVEVAAPRSTFRRMVETDPRSRVVMSSDPMPGATGNRQSFTPASYRQQGPDRVIVRVTTEAPGLLVVADTWMPGWTATINGRPSMVLRGDHAFRVVPLNEAGPIEVVMTYRAPGLVPGAVVSTASLVMLALICLKGVTRGMRPAGG